MLSISPQTDEQEEESAHWMWEESDAFNSPKSDGQEENNGQQTCEEIDAFNSNHIQWAQNIQNDP
jgi:hypothetical protein